MSRRTTTARMPSSSAAALSPVTKDVAPSSAPRRLVLVGLAGASMAALLSILTAAAARGRAEHPSSRCPRLSVVSEVPSLVVVSPATAPGKVVELDDERAAAPPPIRWSRFHHLGSDREAPAGGSTRRRR